MDILGIVKDIEYYKNVLANDQFGAKLKEIAEIADQQKLLQIKVLCIKMIKEEEVAIEIEDHMTSFEFATFTIHQAGINTRYKKMGVLTDQVSKNGLTLLKNFTPIYSPDPRPGTFSINAGNSGLGVGGAGLNAAFRSMFDWVGNKIDYTNKHKNMRSHNKNSEYYEKNGSEVFIDVLPPDMRPFSTENVGMIYIYSPNGTDSNKYSNDDAGAKKFFDDVKMYTLVIIQAVIKYNNNVYNKEKIQTLRIPVYSGEIFMHPYYANKHITKGVISAEESKRIATTHIARLIHHTFVSNPITNVMYEFASWPTNGYEQSW